MKQVTGSCFTHNYCVSTSMLLPPKIAKRLNFLKGRQPRNLSQTNGYLVIYDLNSSGMKQM